MPKDKKNQSNIESLISEAVETQSTTERIPGKDRLIKTDQFQLGAGRVLQPSPRVSSPTVRASKDSSAVQSAVRVVPPEVLAPSKGKFTLGIILGIVVAIGIGAAVYFLLWPK